MVKLSVMAERQIYNKYFTGYIGCIICEYSCACGYEVLNTHSLWLFVLGEAKGLRKAAIRTSCLLPPPVFTRRMPASGVFRPLEPGVRPGVAATLGVCLAVAARPGVRLGVPEVDAPAPSPSHVRPGVSTKHSSPANSLVLCSLCVRKKGRQEKTKAQISRQIS